MAPKITLYGFEMSPPSRAVVLTLNALKLEYNWKETNLLAGETMSPEYQKKNPQHTIPMLEDDGKYIWDSHAICAYLVRKYGKTDALYPKDFYQRAVVDQRLHFENSVLYMSCMRPAIFPIFKGELSKEKFDEVVKSIQGAYDMLEKFLVSNQYLAGDGLTIADLSIVSTLSSVVSVSPLNAAKQPKLSAWFERIKQLPYYEEANGRGAKKIHHMIKDKLEQYK